MAYTTMSRGEILVLFDRARKDPTGKGLDAVIEVIEKLSEHITEQDDEIDALNREVNSLYGKDGAAEYQEVLEEVAMAAGATLPPQPSTMDYAQLVERIKELVGMEKAVVIMRKLMGAS
jgi:uncharacterized coiled-coil protein SlyX